MTQQIINIGTTDNDGTGDSGRSGADKINDNFDEVYHQAGMAWDAARAYVTNDFSKVGSIVYIAQAASTNIDPTTDTDYSHWKPDNLAELQIYDNTTSGATATNVQTGLDEAFSEIDAVELAGAISSYATSAVDLTVTAPLGRNMSVLDYTAATGTITLPASANMTIGGRVLIKKSNSTMGSVNINADGADAKQWGAVQLKLYSDGDYWLAMWDGSRWCLLDGYETGSNANGAYRLFPNSSYEMHRVEDPLELSTASLKTFLFPYNQLTTTPISVSASLNIALSTGTAALQDSTGMICTYDTGTPRWAVTNPVAGTDRPVTLSAFGSWY